MNLNLASHHNRLAKVGLGEKITKKLSNLLLSHESNLRLGCVVCEKGDYMLHSRIMNEKRKLIPELLVS